MANTIIPGHEPVKQPKAEFFFKPNVELLNKVLASKQLDYDTKLDTFDKLRAKIDEVSSLAGYDTKRHAEKTQEYETEVAKISNLYHGDLTKATREFRNFVTKVGKDFNKHGEFTAIGSRHSGYMTNYKEISERYKKGEINKQKAYQLQRELKRSKDIGIGKNHQQYNSWNNVDVANSTDIPDFLTKFMALAKKSSEQTWGKGNNTRNTPAGIIEYRMEEDIWVSEEKLREQGMLALRNDMNKNGDLAAMWTYEQEMNDGAPTIKRYDDMVAGSKDKLDGYNNKLEQLNSLTGKPLQEFMNSEYESRVGHPVLDVNGLDDKKTQMAKAALTEVMTKDVDNSLNYYNKLAGVSDPVAAVGRIMQEKFYSDMLNREVASYSGISSFKRHKEGLKTIKDPEYKFLKDLELMKTQYSLDIAKSDYEYDRDKKEFIDFTRLDAGVTTEAPYGSSVEDYTKEVGKIQGRGGQVLTNLFMQIEQGDIDSKGNFTEQDQYKRNKLAKDKEINSKLNVFDIADATFKKEGKKLYLIKKDKTVVPLSESFSGDMSVLHEIRRNARLVKSELNDAKQVAKEGNNAVMTDPNMRWSDKDRKMLAEKPEYDRQVEPYMREAYELYLKSNSVGSITDYLSPTYLKDRYFHHMFGAPKPNAKSPLTYDEYKATLANPKTFVAGGYSFSNLSGPKSYLPDDLYLKMLRHNSYMKTYEATNKKYNNALGVYYSKVAGTPTSTTSSTLGFHLDGKTHEAEARQKASQAFFDDPKETASMPFMVTGEDNKMTQMTMADKTTLEEGVRYDFGPVLIHDSKNAWVVPYYIYDAEDKVVDEGTARLGMEHLNPTFMMHAQRSPSRRIGQQLMGLAASGKQVGHFEQYSTNGGGHFDYKLTRAAGQRALNNPNPNHETDNAYYTFIDVPVVQMKPGPGGYMKMKTVTEDGEERLVRDVKIKEITQTAYNKGEKFLMHEMHNEQLAEEFVEADVYDEDIPVIVPVFNKDGTPKRNERGAELGRYEYISRYMKLQELINDDLASAPERIARQAKRLGLSRPQLKAIFGIVEKRIQYRNAKNTAHPDLLEAGNTYINRTVTSTKRYKF